jgi:complement component 1 Q subcomponent-binding protein
MSRIAKNASILLKRMSFKSGLFANNLWINSNKSMSLRSLSTVLTNRQFVQMSDNLPLIVSKRLAANSPQSDKQLSEFLESEIELEKKSQKKALPSIADWTINADGSNITLKKKYFNEEITVKANINHSVDAEGSDPEIDPNSEEMGGEMVSKPDFAVEIKRGNTILGINCSFIGNEDNPDEQHTEEMEGLEDDFQINEFSIFEGEFKENSYAVSGDVMDGSMYDLMMDLLQERGVNQDFSKKLIEYSTVYEHSQYVGLLEKLKSFINQK